MASPEAKRRLNRARAKASDLARNGKYPQASSTLLADMRKHPELSAWLDNNRGLARKLLQAQGDLRRYESVLNNIRI